MVDLTRYQELVVRQEVEPLEVFTGFETSNRYSVMTPQGDTLLYAYEESGWLGRQFLRTHRPLTLRGVDNERRPVFAASRAFFWFLSHLDVRDGDDRPLGSLHRRFSVLRRRFSLEDSGGRLIGEITGSPFRRNTFILERQGREMARITKQWSGILKEAFSDADTFRIQLQSPGLDQDAILLILAAAFAIDLDAFESGGRGGGFSMTMGR